MKIHLFSILSLILMLLFGCFANDMPLGDAPANTTYTAWFPSASSQPASTPVSFTLQQGSHESRVTVSSLQDMTGFKVCIQRSISTPLQVSDWDSCTFSFSVKNSNPAKHFEFNARWVEGNIPYYVNVALDDPQISVASVMVSLKVSTCTLGFVRALNLTDVCYSAPDLSRSPRNVTIMASDDPTPVVHYYRVISQSSSTRLVDGMKIIIESSIDANYTVYGSANMGPSNVDNDIAVSGGGKLWATHINTPTPGSWFFAIAFTASNEEDYYSLISVLLFTTSPDMIAHEIPPDSHLISGPSINPLRQLQFYRVESNDGSLYLSLSTRYPDRLSDEEGKVPFQVFVASNAIPGAFANTIDHDGSNIFSDWIGCKTNNCKRMINIALPQTKSPVLPITYIIAVLPLNGSQGHEFVLWKDTTCPYCERGYCLDHGDAFGTCKCPTGWTQINCSKWGANTLTPQIIVLIVIASLVAVAGIGIAVYFGITFLRQKLKDNMRDVEGEETDSLIDHPYEKIN